jgi:hypothetical protein
MLGEEDNEYRKCDIIRDLATTRSKRAYQLLLDLIRTSPSTVVRKVALDGLGSLGSDESLRTLVEFSREPFPEWKEFRNITPQMVITWALQEATKQDFGRDFAAWEKWLREHPGFPPLAD